MSEKILDVEEFMSRVQNDKELFFELLDIFVQDFGGKRKELEDALAQGNSETVKSVAHFLKGSCSNISTKPMREVFSKMEEEAGAGNISNLKEQLVQIDQQYEELVKFIGELRTSL